MPEKLVPAIGPRLCPASIAVWRHLDTVCTAAGDQVVWLTARQIAGAVGYSPSNTYKYVQRLVALGCVRKFPRKRNQSTGYWIRISPRDLTLAEEIRLLWPSIRRRIWAYLCRADAGTGRVMGPIERLMTEIPAGERQLSEHLHWLESRGLIRIVKARRPWRFEILTEIAVE